MAPCLMQRRCLPNVKHIWLALLLAYCSFIFFLSHQSALPTPMLFVGQDKLFHAAAYAILGFLAMSYCNCVIEGSGHAYIVAMIFSGLYGASDEWHQSFIIGREADVFDWLADCIGATIAINITRYARSMAR